MPELPTGTVTLLFTDIEGSTELLRELGEHGLKDLVHAEPIFQLVIPGLPADFPPLKTLTNRPHNLPAQLTPLIGRSREVAAVCALLGCGEGSGFRVQGSGEPSLN